MVKDFSYILKRVIIGVLIALILMFLKGGLIANVNAQSIWTSDLGLTSMYDMNSNQSYDLQINPSTTLFKGRGRGTLLMTYYMTDYSDFQVGVSTTTTTSIPRYIYVTTSRNYNYMCDIGTNGYQKTSDILYQYGNGAITGGPHAAMTSVYSVKCEVELEEDEYITYFHAVNVGVQANTYVQFSRYATFIQDSQAALKESIDKQTEETKKQTDAITSDESPSDSDIESIFESEDDSSSSPVSDLITMPITLLEKLNDGFSGSCGSYNLGSLYGHNIILPCIDMEGLLGSELWTLIDMLFSLFLVYNIGLMVISIYESITSLEDGFRSLYTPKHAEHEYEPKHGGGD